jgi:alanyl-tRNA synthetase
MSSAKDALMLKLQKDWKNYWFVELFKERGFKRSKCKICGKYFWSMKEQETCNDARCKGYSFLDKQLSKKMDYFKTWESVREYFVKNGHVPLKRYPTICRWYPLYFTIAGIVDFYRVVGSKLTFEFPDNPVILSQPCLRFNDISNVGLTGKHNTCFNMVQQSSVFDGKKGYWKDRCIELDYGMLTKVLRVPPEEINFIEDAWIGYGAFGYSLEYFVGGLELGNAVFTEFEGTPDNYSPLKEKIIDMGSGLERLCWLGQRTPMSYDAVFGPLVEKMIKKTGIDYDKKFFSKYSRFAGYLDFTETNVEKEKEKIAKILKVSREELFEKVDPLEKIYAIADHSRTLLFALSDGGLPSNVGGGYNLRVILRRALNFIEHLDSPFDIEWVVEEQAKYLKDMNPDLLENLEHVNKIIESEKRKYKETKERVRDTVNVLIKSKSVINEEKLMELYDSQGISPELLREADKENVLKVKIPEDFYLKITDKHLQEKTKEEKKLFDVSGMPETKKLYYDNEKLYEFKAKVLKVDGENVILDQSAFYPRGGGQEPDLGSINDCRVYDVEREDNVIIHRVSNADFKVGSLVDCKVDSKRRDQIKKHHTATHLINGSARKLLGYQVWQAGGKKDVDKAHLDVTHYEPLTEEQTREIERTANEAIRKGLKIKKEVMQRTEAEKKYGFILYQGGVIPETTLRIISVPNFDVEACGGLHVDNTSEVEEIFIFNTRRVQDGIIRIEYVAGKELVEKTRKEIKERKALEKDRLKRKMEEIEQEKERIRSLEITSNAKIKSGKVQAGINYIDTEDMKELEAIGRASVRDEPENFSILIGKGIVFGIRGKTCKKNIGNIVKEAARMMGGSAGGTENELKGGGPLKDKGKEAYEKSRNFGI